MGGVPGRSLGLGNDAGRDLTKCPLLCYSSHIRCPTDPYPLGPLQVEPPELPEDLKHWVTYNEVSSQLLRAESGLSKDTKAQ